MGIIEQAIKDHAPKKFYTSNWFTMLAPPEWDGEAIWRQVEKNYEDVGRGLQPDPRNTGSITHNNTTRHRRHYVRRKKEEL